MKKTYKSIILTLGLGMALSACNDLDTTQFSSAVTGDQKEEALEFNPELAQAAVNAMSTAQYAYTGGDATHNFFGLPSMMMYFDSDGQDMISAYNGYNWYWIAEGLLDGTNLDDQSYLVWNTMYGEINTENNILLTIPEDTTDETSMFYRAQALCFRAFDYWVLSQFYAMTYFGFEDKPCVPIITDKNLNEVAENGVARSTVKEVYEQILSDLNEAIELLTKTPVTAQKVVTSKPKRFFNLDAAYGQLARVYLTMHDYANAEKAAQSCLNSTTCVPYSMSEVSRPTFISLDDASWLWGQPVSENDRAVTTGICNFPSMMGSFNYGYVQYGAWKWINYKLYDYIPSTDVRKGWWLDDNYNSPNITEAEFEYLKSYGYVPGPNLSDEDRNGQVGVFPRTQVKFAPYNYVLGNTTNASDIPYFRIEEVYYILYEAMAMNGNGAGALSGLQNFVKTYRNPNYNFNSSDPAALQDEIWMQRRVEFWGEGLVAWFDLKRLGKPLDRKNSGYPQVFEYYVAPYGPSFMFPIPQQETQTNPLIPESANNPAFDRPAL